MKKEVLVILIVLIAITAIFYSTIPSLKQNEFEIIPPLIKVVVDSGETINTNIEIKNLGKEKEFNIGIGNLKEIIYLDKTNFKINKGQTENIQLNISGLSSYGTHMGHILVSDGITKETIPIIVSINSPVQLFAINLDVSPEKKELTKKEEIITDVKFFNLYDRESHTLDVNYEIINIYGETIFSESEQITISSKSSFTKEFSLPENIKTGDYTFAVSSNYLNSTTTSSYLFSVTERLNFSYLNIDFLAWIVIIFSIITFILILYLINERRTVQSELKEQQREQIKSFSNKIYQEKKRQLSKAKTGKQKDKIIKELKDAKKKVLKELKKQQKEQQKELKKSRKKKNFRYNKKQLSKWKKESYAKALRYAKINYKLRRKLSILKDAYSEGLIQKESYLKGASRIKSAKRGKTKTYK